MKKVNIIDIAQEFFNYSLDDDECLDLKTKSVDKFNSDELEDFIEFINEELEDITFQCFMNILRDDEDTYIDVQISESIEIKLEKVEKDFDDEDDDETTYFSHDIEKNQITNIEDLKNYGLNLNKILTLFEKSLDEENLFTF